MKSSLLAIRAIGAEFANRIYWVVAIAASVISVCLLGVALWLTTFSDWWWLLFTLLIIPASVVIGVLIVVKLVIRSVTPPQSHTQKVQTKAFVDKLQRLSEASQTPKAILLFQIVRDIAAPRENGLIASISSDTISLKHDFTALSKTFK
jgi:hypothetical protein